MEWLAVLILAVVQGLTEFLPVSSSGHLSLVDGLLERLQLHAGDPLTLTIVLHAGTLVAVVVFYRRELWQLTRDPRTVGLVVLATIPAVLFGLPLKYFAKGLLESPLLAAALLPVTGALLLWASAQPRGDRDYRELTWAGALAIGCGQALAVFPGISRSGSTISVALRLGLEPKAAAAFSFLLSVPVIGGACLLELIDLYREPSRVIASPQSLLLGVAVAGLVGWFALRWLLAWVSNGRLHWFAWWCIGLGMVALAWQLTPGEEPRLQTAHRTAAAAATYPMTPSSASLQKPPNDPAPNPRHGGRTIGKCLANDSYRYDWGDLSRDVS